MKLERVSFWDLSRVSTICREDSISHDAKILAVSQATASYGDDKPVAFSPTAT